VKPGLGKKSDFDGRKAGIDNRDAKWPLKHLDTDKVAVAEAFPFLPQSCHPPLPRVGRSGCGVLTEEDTASTKIHEHNLTQRKEFKGRAQSSHKLLSTPFC